MNRRPAVAFLAAGLSMMAGCRGTPRPQPGIAIQRGPAPTYADVAAAYNTRVQPLERLWARTVVRLKFINGEGKPQKEQVEGFCQYVRPTKALVSFLKVGQAVAMLGSDDERYWWIELGNAKQAFVGKHANATPERIAAAGLRVHPLDLMELLALTPLPTVSEGCSVAWSADGRVLIVTVPGRQGVRKLSLDPDTNYPSRIELLGEAGRVLAFSELSRFERVALKAGRPGEVSSYVPTKVRFEADEGATQVVMDLSDPQNDPNRFRPAAFNFERLLEANGVPEANVRDLDLDGRAFRGR